MSSRITQAGVGDTPGTTPYQLRALVLDYLSHSGHVNTAKAFIRDGAVRQLDMDGDEIMQSSASGLESNPPGAQEFRLKQAELRNQIRFELLCGRVDDATNLLNKHFPSVLSESIFDTSSSGDRTSNSNRMEYTAPTSVQPSHLALNLRIQAFIEACRTVPLVYDPTSDSSISSLPATKATSIVPADGEEDPDTIDQQTALLKSAQKLYALAKMLPSDDHLRYVKELECVVGLIAYKVPEESSVSGYLRQERRSAVADQIDSAILYRLNLPVISRLELYVRYTSTIWSLLHEWKVKPRQGMVLPTKGAQISKLPSKGTSETETQEVCPRFDLSSLLDSQT